MSKFDFRSKQADISRVHKTIKKIVKQYEDGDECIFISPHAIKRQNERSIDTVDIVNILLSPASRVLGNGDFENGSWRYRFGTKKMVLVVSIWPKGDGLNVVTVWRVN